MKKFSGLHAYLTGRGVIRNDRVVEPGMVDFTDLFSVHSKRYGMGIWEGTLGRKEIRKLGLPWSKKLAVRSRVAVQGTINASIMALQDGVAGNLAGGTHHAMPDAGEGFCVFNDVAVAIKTLKRAHWVRNVLIIDCDVHQGNGTSKIFEDDDEVYTFSIHGQKNYPFVKPPSNLDIGLEDGTRDQEYLSVLERALQNIFSEIEPDIVFYLAGIDPLETDHFGRLSMSLNGLRERERLVIESVTGRDIPIVLLLSGGYAPTLRETIEAHAVMYEEAAEITKSYFN